MAAENTPFLYHCVSCGAGVDLHEYAPGCKYLGLMYHNHECYECSYWRRLITNRPKGSLVIDGELITFSYTRTNPFTAILHRVKHIVTHNAQAYVANNIVSYGKVPERYKQYLPNEGTYVPRSVYAQIKKNEGLNCRKKGCYDRYHCFFYHPEHTEPSGPWNEIPANYKPGWEGCPMFVNKNTVYND